jgi:SAM-dependent methyltransferase
VKHDSGGGFGPHDSAVPTVSAVAHGEGRPSRWVERWSQLVPARGTVLDVAAGSGRHARWFAALGHPVTALERDPAALAALACIEGVEPVAIDLEGGSPWPFAAPAGGAARRFAAVVVTNYLHRPLLPRLIDALEPGGILLYETFARGNETLGKPSNPAFLLAPGELLEAVAGRLRVVAYEDGFTAVPRPAFIQHICAVADPAPQAGRPEGTFAPARYDLAF